MREYSGRGNHVCGVPSILCRRFWWMKLKGAGCVGYRHQRAWGRNTKHLYSEPSSLKSPPTTTVLPLNTHRSVVIRRDKNNWYVFSRITSPCGYSFLAGVLKQPPVHPPATSSLLQLLLHPVYCSPQHMCCAYVTSKVMQWLPSVAIISYWSKI